MTMPTDAATSNPVTEGEVCFNLWAYMDEASGVIHRIAARPYVLGGSETQRSEILRTLSATDFYAAPWASVPEQFIVVGPDGRRVPGAIRVTALHDHHGELFGPLIESLATMPTQLISIGGRYTPVGLTAPKEFTYVLTVVIEHEDGRLIPQVPVADRSA